MKRPIRILLITVIILIVAGMILYKPLGKIISADNADAPSPMRGGIQNKTLFVNAKVIAYETLEDGFYTIGSILPDEQVDLSFETSGKIVSINFAEGAFVKKGQLLAKVNDAPLQAELKKLEARYPLANDRVARQKKLFDKDFVSKDDYQQVNTALAELEADIELVKAKIEQTELRAPFDGIIGLRSLSEGQYVDPTRFLAKLTKISPLKIEFSINERQANDVIEGTRVKFRLQGNSEQYEATVYAVESEVDTKTRTLTARATYPNVNRKLIPGRSASIEIRLRKEDRAITIPSEAMISEMGRDIAYVYNSGKAHLVEVSKGLRTSKAIQILDGIKPGDTVITSGSMQLRDGMPVSITLQ
ncbi:MAG: efflux RND transporter periplasmic adaptor subunit [Ignavibacteria bacterium]|jgi:membrane fusion protein (multidrug efflux system)|nr:efflux RND transporter periplasmic adaptor subunit [Ignavibacteria bacterium]